MKREKSIFRRVAVGCGGGFFPIKFLLAAALCSAISLLSACSTYKGGKVVEGTDIAAGMSVPQSGGTLQIDALNFLTGFRFLFAEDSSVKCIYAITNSVRAFGCYESATVKSIEIQLEPTVDEEEVDAKPVK